METSNRTAAEIGTVDILCIVGARPNFMKIAPVISALRAVSPSIDVALVHTGQHYDKEMNDTFFQELGIPRPDIALGVGSGSHTEQTARIMLSFEPVLASTSPLAVLVVGDVNSTIACSLVAAKENVPVIHVEAGLRSFDRRMPEEINRILTDRLSTLLFTTEKTACEQLKREGVADEGIHFVGNVMIDTLYAQLERAVPPPETLRRYQRPSSAVEDKDYALLTLHRPSNVDDVAVLEPLLGAVVDISSRLPVIFPVHPRTAHALDRNGWRARLEEAGDVVLLPPLGYLEMLGMMRSARLVLTDSGGLQEETTALGVPCVTLRENTERPITVEQGTNMIVGSNPDRIIAAVEDILETGGKAGRTPELWDGQAAQRLAAVVSDWLLTQPEYCSRHGLEKS